MKRWTFNLLAAVSLTTLLLTILLWARCERRADWLDYDFYRARSATLYGLRLGTVAPDRISAYWYSRTCFDKAEFDAQRSTWSNGCTWTFDTGNGLTGEGGWDRADFDWHYEQDDFSNLTEHQFQVALPCYAIVIACALPLIVWFGPLVRRRCYQDASLCPSCGYDIRATPELCPECGAVQAIAGAKNIG